MAKLRSILAAGVAMAFCGGAAQATYLPTGPQTNVALSTVLSGGWTLCYSGAYGEYGASIAGIQAACNGSNLMLAGRATGSDTLLLLAQAPSLDVMFDTGANTDVVHNANGTDWYFNNSWSWGFAPEGVGVNKESCDASGIFDGNTAGASERLCWHTGGGTLNGGWRVGENVWLNGSTDFERLVFTSNGAVPELGTWMMMVAGFGAVGFGLRRRRSVAVSFA